MEEACFCINCLLFKTYFKLPFFLTLETPHGRLEPEAVIMSVAVQKAADAVGAANTAADIAADAAHFALHVSYDASQVLVACAQFAECFPWTGG